MARDVFQIAMEGYRLLSCADGLPDSYERYCQNAAFVDELDRQPEGDHNCFLAIGTSEVAWPYLVVVVGRILRWPEQELCPGALVVPETHRLFIGLQERLLAYDLAAPMRLWEDREDTDREFWGWSRHGDTVLMAAELELAAWDGYGRKLWSTFVEPPWDYRVECGTVHLTVLDTPVSFSLEHGPSWGGRLPWDVTR
ncbi:MAG: hypothetical protein JWO42_1980 [Chloroflexi bacterium]|nr:hypothetical protein [Chloroflexota bacterium]